MTVSSIVPYAQRFGGVARRRGVIIKPQEGDGAESSYYSGGQGNCVEAADGIAAAVPVRDSKRRAGPVLAFGRAAWSAFVDHLR